MNRRILVIISAIVIIALGFFVMRVFRGMKETPEERKLPPPVRYVKASDVIYSNYRAIITAYGKLNSTNKIELLSEVTGIVEETTKPFKVGTFFAKGEAMLKIDDSELRMNLYSTKSDFLNTLAKILPDMKYDFPEAFPKWEKYLENFDFESKVEALPQHNSPKEKYFLASRNIYKLYYSIKSLETRLDKHTIRAPFSGTLTAVMTNQGAIVRPLVKLGEFAGTDAFELELSVEANELPYLKQGNLVKVSGVELSNELIGRIIRIAKNIEPSTQTVKVFVALTGSELKDGMYLKAEIEGEEIQNVLRIPRKAIYNNEFVYVINDGVIEQKQVEIIKVDEKYAYLRGINNNVKVIEEALTNVVLGSKFEALPQN